MIEHIKKEVEKLVAAECKKCIEEKGLFVDGHQGYAVIKEEVEESEEDLKAIKQCLDNVWNGIRRDTSALRDIKGIKSNAIHLACEAIQVAAMAEKYIESFEEGK